MTVAPGLVFASPGTQVEARPISCFAPSPAPAAVWPKRGRVDFALPLL